MEKLTRGLLCTLLLIFVAGTPKLYAGANNHYVNGVEGIKGGSVPPPGFYYKMYNAFYTADELTDKNGDEIPNGFEVDVYAISNRFIWVSDKKLFGADYFMDMSIPIVKTDFSVTGFETDDFGIGDINVEPFGLAWHGPRYDAALSLSVFLPFGEYDEDRPNAPDAAGKGFTSFMLTFGGTYYLDENRTLSASFLGRYEAHTKKDGIDFKPGHDFHFEWGIGKSFAKIWEAGIAGYCQWQVTDDEGSVVTDKSVHDQVYAIGPEISVFIPTAKAFLSLRGLVEFQAQDRSEGRIIALTLTKIF